MNSDIVQRIAISMPALLLSLCVHEYAHAQMATRLGDDTARQERRLTLSPLSHLDPVGSVLVPLAVLLFAHTTFGTFGWARPVPFRAVNFSRKVSIRTGTALTAIAGPLSNIVLAVLSLLALRLAVTVLGFPTEGGETHQQMLVSFLVAMSMLNVLLAVFNLLPVPPLDGGYLLPRSLDGIKARLSRYSFLLIIVIFMLPLPGVGQSAGGLVVDGMWRVLARAAFAGA